MNEQIQSTLRAALMFAGGLLVARGYLTSEQLAWGVGGAIAVATAVWAVWKNRPAGLIKATAKLETVTQIQVKDQALANAQAAEVKGPVDVAADKVTATNQTNADNAAQAAVTGTAGLY